MLLYVEIESLVHVGPPQRVLNVSLAARMERSSSVVDRRQVRPHFVMSGVNSARRPASAPPGMVERHAPRSAAE